MEAESIGILGALAAGFLGSVHCLGMCGGIAGALGMHAQEASGRGRFLRLAGYNIGRICSYAAIGALLGFAGSVFGEQIPLVTWSNVLRILTGLLLLAIGLQIAFGLRVLGFLDKVGARVWRILSPAARRIGSAPSGGSVLALGALWGWLPCGLVYSVALLAAVSGSAAQGALVMLAFGAGTLPAMVAAGAAAARVISWSRNIELRRFAGVLLLAFGLWTAVMPASELLSPGPVDHSHHMHGGP